MQAFILKVTKVALIKIILQILRNYLIQLKQENK